jgi:small GTP-binding protein
MTQEIIGIKMAICGIKGAGKTSLANAIKQSNYILNEEEASTNVVNLISIDNEKHKLNVWDLSGDDRYASLLPAYLKKSNIVLNCIDFSQSLDKNNIKKIYDCIKDNAEKDAAIIFVGTKCNGNSKTDDLKNILGEEINEKDVSFFEVDVKFLTGIKGLKEKINQIGTKKQQALDDKLYHNGLFTDASNTLINLVKDRFPHQDTNKNSPQCEKIREALEDLKIKLKPTNANIEVNIDKATKEFYQACYKVLGPSRKTQIGKAILAVGAAVSLLVVSGLIGFCIGLGLGGWTGPGAIVPALVGLGIGLLSGSGASITALGASKLLLFKPNEEMKQVDEVMEKAENFKP